MNNKLKNAIVNVAIIVACIIGVLIAFSLLQEIDRTTEILEQSKNIPSAEELLTYYTQFKKDEPEENPDEDILIEMALVEQGYYRDDIPLSYELQDYLQTACEEFGIRYPLALAVIEKETNFQNVIGDNGNSIGYFQIQPRWWHNLMEGICVNDLTEPYQNFRTGCAILCQLIDMYGNETDALTAYNSGRPGDSEYASAVLEMTKMW